MSRKSPMIPTKGPTFRPPLPEQRAMIEQTITNARRQGYELELKIEALELQLAAISDDPEETESGRKQLDEWATQKDQAYRVAKHFQAKLDRMPKPKPKDAAK